ncbi:MULTISPECIES: lamin tail domain-containing protein [Streptomycetaceae]|uniref:LTD domain-containing protein n=1 Tax=Streptantibioticus cattleyicolor (strain ATCC 35852 / DSM 46488 / JCM 4925 / NBRC 14057 / NRRL 8057) TaxID=1003195 RepID=F8JVY2_STREN|nr:MULTISPECIES: lamin tail domain-containing protein [Streptomycetaceae]AEW92613.1 hypothetical protein SCATT_02420 [Streptantibioticus cattleyicolor NRRL 8057 = DSM 46488]MYS57393.1 lamin tail domain-containing protein [Streptomyces sp. SID5468]CCB72967.1 conserved exported protein of unknown function [Streptantibioticus cattleyicolor NRRL 8057 = DSM 46488]
MRLLRALGTAVATVAVAVTSAAVPVAADAAPPARQHGNVHFDQIRYRPLDDRGVNGQWVKLTNDRHYTVDLRGWTLDERHDRRHFVLPEHRLRPGASVWIYSGRGHDSGANIYLGSRGYVWRWNGDTATLRNAHHTRIDTCSWNRTGDGITHCS